MNQKNNNSDEFEFIIEDLSIDDAKIEVNADAKIEVNADAKIEVNADAKIENDKLNSQNDNNKSDDNAVSNDNNKSDDNAESNDNSKLDDNAESSDNNKSDDNAETGDNNKSDDNAESNDNNKSDDNAESSDKPEKKDNAETGDKSEEKDNSDSKENDNSNNNSDSNEKKSLKERAKEVPENLKNKREDLKNKWNNRPKNMKEAKDRAKDGLKNTGEKLKNKAKQGAQNAVDNAKEGFKNSDLGRAIDKGKNAIDKGKKVAKGAKKAGKAAAKAGKTVGKAAVKAGQGLLKLFISTLPWSAIVLAVILGIILIILLVCFLAPGIGGDVNDDEIYSNYSKTDQKTLEKLKSYFEKYPNADGTLAMSVVLYPYFNNLHSGNTSTYLEEKDKSEEEIEEVEDEEGETEEDIELEDDVTEDDVYLIPFRSGTIRKRLKKVLKKLESTDEEGFKDYLKSDYFGSDKGYWSFDEDVLTGYNGYKKMINEVKSDYKESFYNSVIEDIYNNKNLFVDYVFINSVCASTLVDAGNIETSDLLKSTVYIDLKKPGCSDLSQCSESYYSNYLTLEEYAKGVVYEEIGDNTDLNQIAAQMVAAKTFTLSRRPGKIKQDLNTGAYVIPMLWSTADQDFCHTKLGCNSDDIKSHYGYNTNGDSRLIHGANRGPASDSQMNLYNQAWEMSKDVYVIDKNGAAAQIGYYVGCPSNGKCMDQDKLKNYPNVDYKSILSSFYSAYAIATVEGDISNVQTAGALVCTNASTNLSAKRAKIVSFALEHVDKIPYYEGGLASVSGYDKNDFNTDIEPDVDGRTKKGLGNIGFLNWIYWTNIDENFGNTNSSDSILSNSYEIEQKELLMGDIGYSADKSVFAIYVGENKWVFEDSVSGNVVSRPDDRFTKFLRLNLFKQETYNYTIRKTKPTVSEWSENNMLPIGSTNYIGECPWYSRNRAYEIIRELYNNGSLTKEKYSYLYKRLNDTSGNGGDFYPNGPADNGYPGSTNIDDVKAGAFMGMTSGSKYGHVVVIEYASPDEDKIIVTDGWASGDYCTKSNFSCINFRYREFSYQEFKNNFLSGNPNKFKGYLYFLEEK